MFVDSSQAAAEYVSTLGRDAAVAIQNLGQSAYRLLEENPVAIAIGIGIVVFLIVLTRPRAR